MKENTSNNCKIDIINNCDSYCISNGGYKVTVDSNPDLGFNYPYLLFIPFSVNKNSTIIVNGSNSINSTPILKEEDRNTKIQEAVDDVKKLFLREQIYKLNEQTSNYPILYPLFPRLRYHGKTFFNHMLSSNSIFNKKDENILKKLGIYRCDRQVIKMIEHAKALLKQYNLNIDDKVIMSGFSASAKFANRFTLLHPEIVKYVIAGGLDGTITLPLNELNNEKLLWPVGIGNAEEINDFKIQVYKTVPQFYFMGIQDTKNDCYKQSEDGTCLYKDILQNDEAIQMYKFLGTDIETRWKKTKKIINELNYNIILKEYPGGHEYEIASEDIKEILVNLNNQNKIR